MRAAGHSEIAAKLLTDRELIRLPGFSMIFRMGVDPARKLFLPYRSVVQSLNAVRRVVRHPYVGTTACRFATALPLPPRCRTGRHLGCVGRGRGQKTMPPSRLSPAPTVLFADTRIAGQRSVCSVVTRSAPLAPSTRRLRRLISSRPCVPMQSSIKIRVCPPLQFIKKTSSIELPALIKINHALRDQFVAPRWCRFQPGG